MKTCTKCSTAKPLSEFWPNRRRGGVHSHCKGCKSAAARRWRSVNPHKAHERYWNNPQGERERHLIRKYGLDQVGYNALFASQHGCCAICGKQQIRALDVDHDHSTGIVRGLLCTSCNRMVGHAGDSLENLEKAAAYLRIVPQVASEFIGAYLDTMSEAA